MASTGARRALNYVREYASNGMPRSVVVSFWLDEELYERLKDKARERGVSVSKLIREAVRAYVERLGFKYPESDEVSGITEQ